MMRWYLCSCLLLLVASQQASAHDLGVAQVVVDEQEQGMYHLRAKLSTKVDPVAPLLPDHCRSLESNRRVLSRVTQLVQWQFTCDAAASQELTVVLPWQREGAMVSYRKAGQESSFEYVDSRNGDIYVDLGSGRTLVSVAGVLVQYLQFGIEHILVGIDHLAFVLALFLVATGWKLVKLVTAFTIGHSLTLCLGVFGWVQIPMAPVEVCIALSIAFMARAALKGDAAGQGFWLVLAFGLLHGLGFASALAEIDIPRAQLLLALFAFNLGVELGQLLFIALIFLCVLSWQRLLTPTPVFRPTVSIVIGSLGMFWVAERLSPLFL